MYSFFKLYLLLLTMDELKNYVNFIPIRDGCFSMSGIFPVADGSVKFSSDWTCPSGLSVEGGKMFSISVWLGSQ